MKISTLLILLSFASVASALPSGKISKQEKVVHKIIDLILDNNTSTLASVFASTENLDEARLLNCVKEASGKIRSRGSKHLYASRITVNPDNPSETLYEFAFFYYFKGKKVFYYKINVHFDHNQSTNKPVDIEFMKMKELSLLDVELSSIQPVSPIIRN